MPFIIMITIIIAIICSGVHSSKGYSAIIGFIGGLLMPIPALIIILIEKENSKKVSNNDNNYDNGDIPFFSVHNGPCDIPHLSYDSNIDLPENEFSLEDDPDYLASLEANNSSSIN